MIPENDLEVLHTLNLTVEQANEIMINNPFVIDWSGFIAIWVFFVILCILGYFSYDFYCSMKQKPIDEVSCFYFFCSLFIVCGLIAIYYMIVAREIALENMDVIARILKLTTKTW